MKKSKQAYYDRYFEKIGKILRTHGKELNFSQNCSIQYTSLPLGNGDTITNPYDIANTINNYFASIAEATERA